MIPLYSVNIKVNNSQLLNRECIIGDKIHSKFTRVYMAIFYAESTSCWLTKISAFSYLCMGSLFFPRHILFTPTGKASKSIMDGNLSRHSKKRN